jgi:hypothetical protein
MSDHSQPATGKQLAYLRALAHQTGTTFVTPRDGREASREIERLRRLKRRGVRVEQGQVTARDAGYAPAPQSQEIDGWGSTARWRATAQKTPRPARRYGRVGSRETETEGAYEPRSIARALASYLDGIGVSREIVAVRVPRGTLVVDRSTQTQDDARLVAQLGADEPRENAQIVSRLYLADPSRGRCRRVTDDDMGEAVPSLGGEQPATGGTDWDRPIVSDEDTTFCLQAAGRQLRWTSTDRNGQTRTVSLRTVVGGFQNYEPAVSMTRSALRVHGDRNEASIYVGAAELERLSVSSLVLNRGLRERVEKAVAQNGLTMSEIAIRCGRVKRDRRGRESGDTSWVARRLGQLAEAGKNRPTPWVHSDVLALIARDGLGISPHEVEL